MSRKTYTTRQFDAQNQADLVERLQECLIDFCQDRLIPTTDPFYDFVFDRLDNLEDDFDIQEAEEESEENGDIENEDPRLC